MGPYDRHWDYNDDGEIDANEEYMRQDFEDFVNHRGLYADDDPDDLDYGDDLDD